MNFVKVVQVLKMWRINQLKLKKENNLLTTLLCIYFRDLYTVFSSPQRASQGSLLQLFIVAEPRGSSIEVFKGF